MAVGDGANVALVGPNGVCEQLELDGLTYPVDREIWYGDRVPCWARSWVATPTATA